MFQTDFAIRDEITQCIDDNLSLNLTHDYFEGKNAAIRGTFEIQQSREWTFK